MFLSGGSPLCRQRNRETVVTLIEFGTQDRGTKAARHVSGDEHVNHWGKAACEVSNGLANEGAATVPSLAEINIKARAPNDVTLDVLAPVLDGGPAPPFAAYPFSLPLPFADEGLQLHRTMETEPNPCLRFVPASVTLHCRGPQPRQCATTW